MLRYSVRLALALSLLIISAASHGQQPFFYHYHLDSNYNFNITPYLVTIGNSYYTLSHIQKQPSLDTTTSIFIKLDRNGEAVWARQVDEASSAPRGLFATSDGHLLFNQSRNIAGTFTNYLVKADTNLSIVWSIVAPTTLAISETDDAYVLHGGSSLSPAFYRYIRIGKPDGAVLGQGKMLLSGSGAAPQFAYALAGGNQVACGQSNGTGSGNSHSFVAVVQPNGQPAWVRSLENISGEDYRFFAGAEDEAGNIYLAGEWTRTDAFFNSQTNGALLKFSAAGDLLFAKHFTDAAVEKTRTQFFSMTYADGVLKVFGTTNAAGVGTSLTAYAVQLTADTAGTILGQRTLNISQAPAATQNYTGGNQSPYLETPDGRLTFLNITFRECVSNRFHLALFQTEPLGESTGCDSTNAAFALADSAIGVAPATLSLNAGSGSATTGAGLTSLNASARSLIRTGYCGCSASGDTTSTTVAGQLPGADAVLIYPNPSAGKLMLRGLPPGKTIRVTVVDATGRPVLRQSDIKQQEIDLPANLPAGIYLLLVDSEPGAAITKQRISLLR